jgi:hypothetical protein
MNNKTFDFDKPTEAVESWWLQCPTHEQLGLRAKVEQHRMCAGKKSSFVNPLERGYTDRPATNASKLIAFVGRR